MCHITIDFNLPDFKVNKTEETPTSIIVYGHTTATPSFHDAHSSFTHEQESNLLLDLVNSTIKDVAIKNMTTEKVIQGIVDWHISGAVDWSTFKFLGTLGIDEIALRKGYKNFITAT